MRFTKAQAALFRAGIKFAHMAPNEAKSRRALSDLARELKAQGIEYNSLNYAKIANGDWDSPGYTYGHFIVASLTGACSEHVSVLFLEDPEEAKDQRAIDEAKYIPADVGGAGPMIVR